LIGSSAWKKFESGDGAFLKFLLLVLLAGGVALLGLTGILELTWPQQTVLGIVTVSFVLWMDRSSNSHLITLTLMLLSVFTTFRYGFWRLSTTAKFFLDPGSTWSRLDAFFVCLLIFAEAYACIVLSLGYLQTLWPLRRTPMPLPEDLAQWPSVDLLIPTYDEPLSVVKYTALAARNIDWPIDRLNIYILDDGRREEFRSFAEAAGIGYMTRDGNAHGRAGNINSALKRLDAPYVAIFNCDHVPTRSFLQITLGWFLRDSRLAMLQTPNRFYSPYLFGGSLSQLRAIPDEGERHYEIVQDGNDFWNATFFCGSCAVLRRRALDEIGGIAVETVTEDAHTSLRIQGKGWNTAYIDIPQAAGLSMERLGGHVQQRIRWARGMVQIMRADNPLFSGGLSLAQRLCCFNAMSHVLYALPRLIFLIAPLIYLVFGRVNIPGYWAAILAYAVPHLILSSVATSRIQGQHRHSFWNEIYETVLAPFVFFPTVLALISPKSGRLDSADQGSEASRRLPDNRIVRPFLFMLGLNAFGILCAIPRAWQLPGAGLAWPLNRIAAMHDGHHPGTILLNLIWAGFNMVILGVAAAVARESQQRRQTVRVPMSVPAAVLLPNGTSIQGITTDLSSGGLMVRMERDFIAAAGDSLRLTLPVLDGDATFPATVVEVQGNLLRARFDTLTLHEEEDLAMVLYSRADTWLGWGESREPDPPFKSFAGILRLAAHGMFSTKESVPKEKFASLFSSVLLLAILFGAGTLSAQAPTPPSPEPHLSPAKPTAPEATPPQGTVPIRSRIAASGSATLSRPVSPDAFDHTLSFADIGEPDNLVLRGVDAYRTVHLSQPQTQHVKAATLKLQYHFSPGLLPALSHLKVSLNGKLVAVLAVAAPPAGPNPHEIAADNKTDKTTDKKTVNGETVIATPSGDNALLQATLALPAELFTHDNQLTFEFVGHYAPDCEDPSHSTLWSQIDSTSTLQLAGTLQPLRNDLKQLPLPFFDSAVNLRPIIPIVFLTQPSPKALQAAGIVASWFGIFADTRPIRFPVSLGAIPTGNVIIIGESASALPPALQPHSSSGPTIAIRANPSDPYSKALVLTGENADELLTAAMALTLQHDLLEGDQVRIPSLRMPAPREPDDAPRWLSTERITRVDDLAPTSQLQGDGSAPLAVSLRLPPDLYYGTRPNLGFHLGYLYNSVPLSNESTLQVYANDAYVGSTPMPHADKASTQLETVIPVSVADMRPFSNSMTMKFLFLLAKKEKCQDSAPSSLKAAILKDSYLDIHDIPHWAVLPNLELFANAGFPFTRRADLADTAVVMPDTAGLDEIEMFLTLMGHFGAQTGYPVLNVSVTNADGMKSDGGKDYLVLGTVDDQPALRHLNPSLPVMIDGSGLHIQDTQGFFAQLRHAWWKVRSSDRIQSGQLETAGTLPDALVQGIEWPSGSKRSAVVISLRDRTVIPDFLTAFLNSSQTSDISRSISVLHGSHFVSYRIGNEVYGVGSLSLWIRLNMLFAEYQWLMALCIIVFCLFLATILRAMLRRHARARLQGDD